MAETRPKRPHRYTAKLLGKKTSAGAIFYCPGCGLVWLKNDATMKEARKPCDDERWGDD